jgi:hypothetical protein
VSKAANRCKALSRLYSCSTRLGTWPD